MEKLRRRYRDEKRLFSLGGASSWPYFDLMDSLECGPLTIPAIPLVPMPSVYKNNNKNNVSVGGGNYGSGGDGEGDEGEEEDEDDYGYGNRSKSRSINYILRKPSMVNRFAGSEREAVKKRKKREEITVAAVEHEKQGKERGKEMELRLAAEIRDFAERMEGMERKKMEMVRQTERRRMEMETKRAEMILDSQRKIVDMIVSAGTFGAFGGSQL
uniref:Trihelix transcription factor ASIL1 n=1 Tax=Rhizophora mucronata TaxID=61149 RepID=A0A2P2IWJ7_RHIMU